MPSKRTRSTLASLTFICTGPLAGVCLFLATTGTALADGNHFTWGYCTWEADELAHRAWGTWVPWFGDAGDWAAGARAAGWTVSPAPQVNTILAMPRGVQGSGRDGHVGWVVDVDSDGGDVTVVSMNWGRYNTLTQHHVLVDGAVQFIAPPGQE